VSNVTRALARETQKLPINDHSAAETRPESHAQQPRGSPPGAVPVLGNNGCIRVDLQRTLEREPLLEGAAQREFAERHEVRVVDHPEVLRIEKACDRNTDARHDVSVTGRFSDHWPQRRDDCVDERLGLTVPARWNALTRDDRAVLTDDPELDVGPADVDRSG